MVGECVAGIEKQRVPVGAAYRRELSDSFHQAAVGFRLAVTVVQVAVERVRIDQGHGLAGKCSSGSDKYDRRKNAHQRYRRFSHVSLSSVCFEKYETHVVFQRRGF